MHAPNKPDQHNTTPQTQTQTPPSWYPLDNAAKIYPSVITKWYTSFFRIEIILTKPIIAEALQKAVDIAIKRFSVVHVEMKAGLFWNFLQRHDLPPTIESIDQEPCRLDGTRLYRILVGGRRLAFEISHLLTDGIGALEIFKTLLCTYYELCYKKLEDWASVISPDSPENPEESEDAYLKYYKKGMRSPLKLKKAFHFPEPRGSQYQLSRIYCSLAALKKAAASVSVGLSTFLCSLSLYVCSRCYPPSILVRHPMRSLYLINLRRFFNSATLRNFFLYVFPTIDCSLKDFSFEQMAQKIHHQIQMFASQEELQRCISSNVNAEKNKFARMTPRFIKNVALKIPQYFEGERLFTLSCSNLGQLTIPKPVEGIIQDVAFFPPPSRVQGRSFCAFGVGDRLCLSTGRYIESDLYERTLVRVLLALGVQCTYYEW